MLADRGHDLEDFLFRHALRVALAEQVAGVRSVDIVHRDPDLTVDVAAVVHPNDVRMPQRRSDVGFPVEPLPVFVVGAYIGAQHFERVTPRQTRMVSQVHLAHAPAAQKPHDGVVREGHTSG